jgi:3-oxoacyl-[acyl-carrier-protein] synthase-3
MSLSITSQRGIRITGTGMALPSDLGARAAGRIDNAELYRALFGSGFEGELARREWTVDDPEKRYGIRSREWIHRVGATPGDATPDVGDLAILAAERAARDAGIEGSSIDIVLAATSTPARITSSLAARVGAALECSGACLDVRAGGAGGLSAWITATRMLGGGAQRALVVAAEAPSYYLGSDEPGIAAVYGDGAGALVLELQPGSESGLVSARFERRDSAGRPFTVPGALPPRARAIDAGEYRFQRPDSEYTERIDETWRATLESFRTLRADLFVPYAVTRERVENARVVLGISADRTVDRLLDLGCLGCAGPIVHLHTALRERRLGAGSTLVAAAVAGGITSAALAWRT